MLLTGSGDELCGPLSALFQAAAYYQPTVDLSAFSAICLLKVPMEISSLLLPPSLVCLEHPAPLLCVPFQFLVYCSVFICVWGISFPRCYARLSQGWLGEYHEMFGTHLFGLVNVSQAGLELVSGGEGSPPVFSV
jgi:hypothetical protein